MTSYSAQRRLDAKRKTDAFAHRFGNLRNAVRIVNLRRIAHHEQTARLEIEVERVAGGLLRADDHPPSCAERKQRDRRSLNELVQVIVMRRDAVAAVAIAIEPDAVERRTNGLNYVLRGFGAVYSGTGPSGRSKPKGYLERRPRNVHFLFVHRSALRAPVDAVADFGKPGVSHRAIDEARRIGNAPAFVVGEHGISRFEERQLRAHRLFFTASLRDEIAKALAKG